MFNTEQRKYLVGAVGEQVVSAAEVMIKNGMTDVAVQFMQQNKLGAEDAAALKQFLAKAQPAAPKTVSFASVSGGAAPVVAAPVIDQHASILKHIAEALTVRRKDGQLIQQGSLAKRYRENLALWPTVDAFGRPFPSLVEICNMTKDVLKQHVTSSGFPKCSLDGLSYYIQEKEGHSLHILRAVNQQMLVDQEKENAEAAAAKRLPSQIVIDLKTVPIDIKAGDWRWYNGQRGSAAMYATVGQHEATCNMLGLIPVQYRALKPTVTVPAAEAPARARRSRKAAV